MPSGRRARRRETPSGKLGVQVTESPENGLPCEEPPVNFGVVTARRSLRRKGSGQSNSAGACPPTNDDHRDDDSRPPVLRNGVDGAGEPALGNGDEGGERESEEAYAALLGIVETELDLWDSLLGDSPRAQANLRRVCRLPTGEVPSLSDLLHNRIIREVAHDPEKMERIKKSHEAIGTLVDGMFLCSTFESRSTDEQKTILRDIIRAKAKLLTDPAERDFIEATVDSMQLSTLLMCAGRHKKAQSATGLVLEFSLNFSVELLSCIIKQYFEKRLEFENRKKTPKSRFVGRITESIATAGEEQFLDCGGELKKRPRLKTWHNKKTRYRVPTESERDQANAGIIAGYVKLLDKYGYLDIALEKIGLLPRGFSGAWEEAIREGDPRAWVQECLVGEKERGVNGHKIALAVHHAVSRGFYEESLEDDNSKRFMKGRTGRGQSYMRSSFETTGRLLAKYTVSSVDYPSDRCTPFERKKLMFLNALAQFEFNLEVEFFSKKKEPIAIARQRHNLVQTLASRLRVGLYKAHADGDAMVCRGRGAQPGVLVGPYPTGANSYEHSLPFVEELTTHTFVKSNFTTEAGADPYLSREMTCAVVYTLTGTKRKVGQFDTGNCTMHIQLKGSQAGYEHQVKLLDKSVHDNVYRIIDSGRQIRDPNREEDLYDEHARSPPQDRPDTGEYVYSGMIDFLAGKKGLEVTCGDEEVAASDRNASSVEQREPAMDEHSRVPASAQSRAKRGTGAIRLPSRNHPQISRATYKVEHAEFILSEHNVGVSGPLTSQLRTDSMTVKLLGTSSDDVPVDVVITDKANREHPVLLRLQSDGGKLPRLLKGYDQDEVRRALGIEATQIAKRCLRERGTLASDGSLLESAGVILHREYKQDLQSVVEAASDVYAAEKGVRGYQEVGVVRGLITYSSGGATMKAGANAETLSKMRIEDELVMIPGVPTVDKGLNKHLLDHCIRSKPMAVFLPGKILRDALRVYRSYASEQDVEQLAPGYADWVENQVSDKDVYFMGYHVVAQARINNPSYAVLEREAKFAVPMDVWRTYQDRVHIVFELRPIVAHQRYIEVWGAAMRGFKVRDDKDYKLFCTFGAEDDLYGLSIRDLHQKYINDDIMPSIDGGIEGSDSENDDEDRSDGDGSADGDAEDWLEEEGGVLTDATRTDLVSFRPRTKTPFDITHTEMVDLGVHVSVAAFHRFKKDCINEEGRAHPLSGETGLGMVVRQHAAPHPIRSYDPPSLRMKARFLFDPEFKEYRDLPRVRRRIEARKGDRRIKYCAGKKADEAVMLETIRQAVVGRVLGDVTAAEAWSGWMQRMGHSSCTFKQRPAPAAEEDDLFLQFMRESVKGSKSDSLSRWVSGQHEKQIPDDLKTAVGFESFWKGIQPELEEFVAGMREGKKKERNQYRHELRDLLDRHVPFRDRKCTSVKAKCEFLAQQIMLDLEEVWCDPFGSITRPEDIVFGPGSLNGLGNLGAKSHKEMADELETLLEAWTSDELDDDYLAAIGLVREGSVVRVMDWGRPIGYQDGEHLGCKTNIAMRRVHCSRGASKKPKFTCGHCHPIALDGEVEPWDSRRLCEIADGAIAAFKRIEVAIPKSCRLAYERKQVTMEADE